MELLSKTEVKTIYGVETFDDEDKSLWKKAMDYLEKNEPEKALAALCVMKKHTAKTMFNVSEAFRRLGSNDDALEAIKLALFLDPFLAIAYYKRGNLNYELKRFVSGLRDFELAELAMHGEPFIDYEHMGMIARLCQEECIKGQEDCLYMLRDHTDPRRRPSLGGKEFLFYPKPT